jgi:hypothetical protein
MGADANWVAAMAKKARIGQVFYWAVVRHVLAGIGYAVDLSMISTPDLPVGKNRPSRASPARSRTQSSQALRLCRRGICNGILNFWSFTMPPGRLCPVVAKRQRLEPGASLRWNLGRLFKR